MTMMKKITSGSNEISLYEQQNLFSVSYSAGDLVQYALSLGFGTSSSSARHCMAELLSTGPFASNGASSDLLVNSHRSTTFNKKESEYLNEEHPSFTAVPTFVGALTFLARRAGEKHVREERMHQGKEGGCNRFGRTEESRMKLIPVFPPPMTRELGVLPRHCLVRRDGVEDNTGDMDNDYPIVHTWQSIDWHGEIPVPSSSSKGSLVRATLRQRFINVTPESEGTFVTTETNVYDTNHSERCSPFCTLRSTALVMGIPEGDVIPYERDEPSSSSEQDDLTKSLAFLCPQSLVHQDSYETRPSQALPYRAASGASKAVDADTDLGEEALLHGWSTLDIAARIIISYLQSNYASFQLVHLEGRFIRPVFIGDRVDVKIWSCDGGMLDSGFDDRNPEVDNVRGTGSQLVVPLVFVVLDSDSQEIVVDEGYSVVHVFRDVHRNQF